MRHMAILTVLALGTACQPGPKTATSTQGAEPPVASAGLSAQDEAAIRPLAEAIAAL